MATRFYFPVATAAAEQTLTASQADAITDYTNLRLRLIANKP